MSLDTFVVLANQYNTERGALAATMLSATVYGYRDHRHLLTRKSNGKVEIVKRTEEPTRQGAAKDSWSGFRLGQ